MATQTATPVPLGPRLEWTSEERVLKVNGQRFRLKGLNWFGFETTENCLHGLWQRPMEDFLDQVSRLGFNALRVPFSVQLALAMDTTTPEEKSVGGDASLKGLSCGAILDRLFESCARRGILIMLDQHRLHPDRGISDVWYDDEFPMARVLESWDVLVQRFKGHWNLFALDLKNENHGIAAWGTGGAFTDWKLAAEQVMQHIAAKHPDYDGLFFVGGVWGKGGFWWGGNLTGVRDHPIELGSDKLNRKVVYTPHVYGPDVYKQAYFFHLSFPNNLPNIWDKHWGFIRKHPSERAVVVGEWGGFCRGKDGVWQRRIARYLRDTGMEDNFYWCLNPNSGDTGGILQDDWVSVDKEKLAILHYLQPTPSRLTRTPDGAYTLEPEFEVSEPYTTKKMENSLAGREGKCTVS